MARPTADEIPALLEPVARRRLPGTGDARVVNWRAAERGLSTETYLFDLEYGDGSTGARPLVFRRPPAVSLYPDYDLLRQVLIMARLRPTAIPVPTVCWLERDATVLGTPYYVMERLPSIGNPVDFPSYHADGLYRDASPAQRTAMWWRCVEAIAAVHALDWRSLRLEALARPDLGAHPLEQVVTYYSELLTWATADRPPPELEMAAMWLRDNLYEPEHPVLCWGDSRLSNILYGPDFDVIAVLDWEIAYIGDRAADLAWLLFVDWACSEYLGVPRLPGTPGRAETIAYYERLTGRAVHHLRYHEVLAALALACPVMRLQTKFRTDGLVDDDFDMGGFCVERIRRLLGG